MQRIIAVILSLVMLFVLASCGLEKGLQSIASEQNKAITRGTIEGDTYSSEYAEITFTKPEAWTFSTDNEIAELMNASADVLDQSNFQKTVTSMISVYDMMVKDPATGANISVAYENLKLTNKTNISYDEYFEAFNKQYSNQTAFSVEIGKRFEKALGVQHYKACSYNLSYNDVDMKQYAYIRKIDNFMHIIMITTTEQTAIADIEAKFS